MTTRNGIPDLLEQNVLIDLDVSIPLGVARGRPEDVHLNEVRMPRAVFGLVKRYLPKDWTAAHRSLEGKALRLIEQHSSPVVWPMGKARFLMPDAVRPVVEGLRGFKAQFDEATEAKVDGRAYAEMRRTALAAHPAFREALAQCFPEVAAMKRRFRFEWHLFEVALPRAARLKVARLGTLDARRKALAEEAEKARAVVGDFYRRHVEAITGEVREVCARVADRVAKGEIITEATLDSVAHKLRWFERMCGVVDPRTGTVALPEVGRLRTLLGSTLAADIRDERATAATFQAALTRAADAVSSMADVVIQPGRYVRRIDRDGD